jgi:amino acid adenylation domain-containing protein
VRTAMLEAQDHQEVPLGALLDAVPSADGMRAAQVSQVLFNFRNMPFVPASLAGLVVRPVDVFNGGCVADLDLEVSQRGGDWECDLRYGSELYDDRTAARLLGHFGTLLDDIVASPEKAVGRLSLLTPDERHRILVGWNDTARELPDCLNVPGLIEAQTRATPDSVALRSDRGAITYRDLDRRASALSESLVVRGISAGSFIGVCMDRSIELVTSILGIWKAGGAFVPLDMDHPRSRLEMMLEDSRPALVIVDHAGLAALGEHDFDTLLIDADYLAELGGRDAPPEVEHQPDAVACVLYTSGSTGLPKGVLSTHRGIANNLLDMQLRYPLSKNDCVLQQTSIGFDGAAHELFWPLIAGAQVYLAPPLAQRDPRQIVAIIGEQKISMFGCTPSVLRLMVDQPGFKHSADLRRVNVMGEVLPPALQDQFFSAMPNTELVNIYGPAEASITVAVWTCERRGHRPSVPIGRPQANVEIYILDAGMEPVPIGVAGEIYIGGVALSRGYLNRPELTAERFIPHPFRPQSGERVYRTGDIARYGADGVIEYIGRRDHQLKIRGVRVELGEIEATLDRLAGVKESVVVAYDAGGEKRVVAYVVLDDKSLTPSNLRRSLENRLPAPFMPAAIVPIDSMPRNPHGKADRAALPDQSHTFETRRPDVVAPRNDLERSIATIWRDLLGVQEIGIRDSFFDFGGHSLLAVRMLQRVSDELGEAVSLRDLYAQPTIGAMAATMSGIASPGAVAQASPVLRLQKGGARPPLFYLHGQPPGGGRYAHALRDFMPADQPIYIVRLPIFDRPVTAEGVSAELVEEIRAAHPTGPYLLAGNCFGAWLALEVARQLLAHGETVPLVAIMHPNARIPPHLGYRSIRRLALLAGVPENLHVTEAASATDYVRRMATLVWQHQRRSSPRRLLGRVAAAGAWAAGYLSARTKTFVSSLRTRTKPPSSPEEQAAANACYLSPDEQVTAHYGYWWDAWMNYVPRPYPGRVTMLWPAEVAGNPPWNPTASWSDLAPALDWRVVPGDHVTMMKDQFQFVAQELRACIDEVTG